MDDVIGQGLESEDVRTVWWKGAAAGYGELLGVLVVGFAVTRTGIPVGSWAWPGNTTDKNVVDEVKCDLIGWKLGHVKGVPVGALGRAGSYRTLDNGLEIKEIVVGGDSEARRRFVVVRNPEGAERDRRKRQDIVTEAQLGLDELEQLDGEPHRKAACRSARSMGLSFHFHPGF